MILLPKGPQKEILTSRISTPKPNHLKLLEDLYTLTRGGAVCQVSSKVWPRATPRQRLGPSYSTNLILNEERGTPLPNIHSPSGSLFHL